jgi:hypothetical protein
MENVGRYILWPFGMNNFWPLSISCGNLVYFSHFGMFGQRQISKPCSATYM